MNEVLRFITINLLALVTTYYFTHPLLWKAINLSLFQYLSIYSIYLKCNIDCETMRHSINDIFVKRLTK